MFDFFLDKRSKARALPSGNNHDTATPQTLVLVEVVGAMGLTRDAQENVDPYVVVKRGGRDEVHRTKPISSDGNPIWTVRTKSLFIVGIPEKAAAATAATETEQEEAVETEEKEAAPPKSPKSPKAVTEDSLVFDVCDGFKRLGTLCLSYDKIRESMTDQRLEFTLQPTAGADFKRAILSLRFRLGTHEDKVFLGLAKESPRSDNSAKTGTTVASKQNKDKAAATDMNFKEVKMKNIFQSDKKRLHGVEHLRVMPGPDPDKPRSEETEWMTLDQINQEVQQPSRNWVHAGYGKVGKIYLEVLACDKLPRMDVSVNTADDTDPFVGIVFEDNLVRTDMLWDDPNPRWMPWTMRAFCFHVRHPTSLLMLGVFDYDETPLDTHDPVGRVVINTANFYSNTEYLLRYNLHHDPRQADEATRGSILIRMRLEWSSEVEAVKASYTEAPPKCIINCENNKAYQVLRYLTRGAVDMETSSVETVKLYAAEVASYWTRYCYFLDVLLETMLWRGRLRISETKSIWFPIRSVAFSVPILILLEYPRCAGSMFFFILAWAMLSINYFASRHPNPWKRVKRSEETNMVVMLGRSVHPQIKIEPNQGVEEGKIVDKVNSIKGERMKTLITEFMYFMLKVYRIYSKSSVSAKFFSTPNNQWSLLNGRLYYIHMMLKYLCNYTRLYLALINWQGYYANKLTTTFVFLGVLFLLPPVQLVSWWTLRILVWTLLGPWMKLIDVQWIHRWYKTSDELMELVSAGVEPEPDLPDFEAMLESDVFLKMSASGRVIGENAIKLKDMREHVFGYFSEMIPSVDASRYPSVPLPGSSARPWDEAAAEQSDVKTKDIFVAGQKLHGTMILKQFSNITQETSTPIKKADEKKND